jgi:hypothetical protein
MFLKAKKKPKYLPKYFPTNKSINIYDIMAF